MTTDETKAKGPKRILRWAVYDMRGNRVTEWLEHRTRAESMLRAIEVKGGIGYVDFAPKDPINPPLRKTIPRATRTNTDGRMCRECGADISDRAAQARICMACDKAQDRERKRAEAQAKREAEKARFEQHMAQREAKAS
jgi:hypothetical protein